MKSGPRWIKELRDKEWIESKYYGEGLMEHEIAKILGCNTKTICYWMKKHGIEARGLKSICDNKNWLREHYIDKLLPLKDIARLAGCSERAITYRLKLFGLKRTLIPRCQTLAIKGKEWLRQKYEDAEIPAWEIAKELGIHEGTIYRYMHAWGIKTRRRGELSSRTKGKISKCSREKWEDPQYREHMCQIIKEIQSKPQMRKDKSERMKVFWRENNLATPEWRKARSETMKKNWREGNITIDMIQSPTSIEITVAEALDNLDIPHESQYKPPNVSFIYDEFIPPKTLVEIHGDYWHSEEHHPENVRRDKSKRAWALKNGYQFIVIWEREIRSTDAIQLVQRKLSHPLSS